jgi:hypothetical protein
MGSERRNKGAGNPASHPERHPQMKDNDVPVKMKK